MAKKVTVIPAVSQGSILQPQKKLRVCAYARVSTGKRAQTESYATQVEYYTEKITNNPLWEFAGVYVDQGITGTKLKGRDEFNSMIAACEDGDIDLILTKSVTRFARNTVDCIQIIRKLKAIGVGICFEKEHLNTLEEESEMMLTLLASVAQGESENMSENIRWSVIKRFESGNYVSGKPAYGYRRDRKGNLVIEETEAAIVREMFHAYLNGMGMTLIARHLTESGIPTCRGKSIWCGCCGRHFFRMREYAVKDRKKVMWLCSGRNSSEKVCDMKLIHEEQVEQAFVTMWNKLYTNQGEILEPLLKDMSRYLEEDRDTEEILKLNEEMHNLSEQLRILNEVMEKGYMDAALFMEKSNLFTYQLMECRRKKVFLTRKRKHSKEITETRNLINLIGREGYQTGFRQDIFEQTVSEIRISPEHEIGFCLKNGLILTEQ